MSSTPREKVYAVRLTDVEFKRLKKLAAESNVPLSDAFRKGAELYLTGGSPEEAKADLKAAVAQAASVLRNL